MTCEFNSMVPLSLHPSSIVLRFLIFFSSCTCTWLFFFAFPFAILAVRRGFVGDGEEREGMEAPRHVEPVTLQRVRWLVRWWSSGGRGGCSLGKVWLAPAGCTRSPTAVFGSFYLYLTPSSSPRMRWYLYNLGGESRMAFFLPPPLSCSLAALRAQYRARWGRNHRKLLSA